MKILLVGYGGQLGFELQKVLSGEYELILPTQDMLDITDENAVYTYLEAHKPDICINCAAYTAVDKAENDIDTCVAVNTDGPLHLAKSSEKLGFKLIHISTDFVFDGINHKAYTEESDCNPLSVYGKSKREGELHILQNAPAAIILRTSWLYSSHGHNFVKTILRLADSKDKISIIADQVGTPTYAKDLADCILSIIESKDWISGLYHFSNEGIASWYDFAHEIVSIKQSNESTKIIPIKTSEYPLPAKRPHYSVLDKTKIKQTFNIEIRHWKDSLRECLNRL